MRQVLLTILVALALVACQPMPSATPADASDAANPDATPGAGSSANPAGPGASGNGPNPSIEVPPPIP